MKRLLTKIFPLIFIGFAMASCALENDNYSQYTVALNLTGWNLPDTVKVSTPFNLTLSSKTESSCVSNLVFIVASVESEDNIHSVDNYNVYAQAIYENHGETCSNLIVYKDTTISLTLSKAGKYYYNFLKDNILNKDSILIIP